MQRVRALLAGVAIAIFLFGGIVAVRTVTRFLWAAVWFAETVGLALLTLLIGYLAYRVLWGVSDDPRRH